MDEIKTVVVARKEGIETDTIGKTPGDLPNINAKAVPAWQLIGIRALRVYLQSLLAVLGADAAGLVAVAPLGSFSGHLLAAVQMALAPAVVSLLWNSLEVLNKLDVSHPQLRG